MPSDWDKFELRAPLLPEDDGKPYFYGSSLDYQDWLREHKPHLIIPEREVVPLDGAIAWTPAHEDAAAVLCPKCLGSLEAAPLCLATAVRVASLPASLLMHQIKPCDFDERGRFVPSNRTELTNVCPVCRGIDRGSRLYCPKCQGSGFDRRAAQQLQIAGVPAPEPPPEEPDTKERRGGEASDEPAAPAPDVPPDRPLTRRELRAQRFGRPDRPDGE